MGIGSLYPGGGFFGEYSQGGTVPTAANFPIGLAKLRFHGNLRAARIVDVSVYASKVASYGAVVSYRLNDAGTLMTDRIRGNTATASGGVTTHAPGLTGDNDRAITVDGTGLVTVPNISALSSLTRGSIECWIKADTTLPAAARVFLITADLASVSVSTKFGTQITATLNGAAVVANGLTLTTRHHLVVTDDGTTLTLYLDGALVTTTPATGNFSLGTQGLLLGGNGTPPGWIGTLDDLSIYGSTLTAAQVLDLYSWGVAKSRQRRPNATRGRHTLVRLH